MMRLAVVGVPFLLFGCTPCEDTFTVQWDQSSSSYLAELVLNDAEVTFNVNGEDVTDVEGKVTINAASETEFTLVGIPSHIEVTIIDDGVEIAHGSADPTAPSGDECANGTLDLDA